MSENQPIQSSQRLRSLDALRGFDMLFIMGLSPLIAALCALFEGGAESWLAQTMEHAAWDGLHHHDTIFPLFLFLAGVSFPFSYAKSLERGLSRGQIYRKIARRAGLLILLGVIYNGLFQFDFAHLRICSVLGRIGVAWAVAALLYIHFGRFGRGIIGAAILVGYYLVCCYIPAPDVVGGDPLTMQGTIVGYVDRLITPGLLLYDGGRFDPEGALSTLPAVVTALMGISAGEYLRSEAHSGGRKALTLFLAALMMLGIGLLWSLECPINKMLWSSSFVLVVGAYGLALVALFYNLIDVRGLWRWAQPLVVVGMNSITIYMAQSIIAFRSIAAFFLGGLANLLPPSWGAVLLHAGYLLACWLFLYFLYRQRIFLKV